MNEEISLMEQVDVLRAACCVAAADGEVTDAEAVVIERIAKKAGVGGASREAMLEMALTSPKFLESQFRFLMRDSERARDRAASRFPRRPARAPVRRR